MLTIALTVVVVIILMMHKIRSKGQYEGHASCQKSSGNNGLGFVEAPGQNQGPRDHGDYKGIMRVPMEDSLGIVLAKPSRAEPTFVICCLVFLWILGLHFGLVKARPCVVQVTVWGWRAASAYPKT